MSRLANVGLAKTDSPSKIRMSTRVGRPADDPSSAEVAGAFPRLSVGSPALKNAGKSELDCARDRSTGGTAGAVADCSGSTATSILFRTSADGAVDGSTAAPLFLVVPSSAPLFLANVKTGSGIDSDGMSDSFAGADGVAT